MPSGKRAQTNNVSGHGEPMKLEELSRGVQVVGIEPVGAVTVMAVERVGADAMTVVYRTAEGIVSERMLFRSDEERLSVATVGCAWGFDADGASFKLAAEALRIRLAHLFDPMMAVHTSNVEPLPHQISAVY